MSKETDYLAGAKLALENAKSLLIISQMSEQSNEYGIAASLNILAAEEALKACFCYSQSLIPSKPLTDFDRIFTDHKTKHTYIQSMITVYKITQDARVNNYITFKKNLSFFESISNEAAQNYKREIGVILKNNDWDTIPPDPIDNVEKAIQWWKGANQEKNLGLYVTLQKTRWISPQSFSKKKFELSKKYSKIILNFSDELHKLFSDEKLISYVCEQLDKREI